MTSSIDRFISLFHILLLPCKSLPAAAPAAAAAAAAAAGAAASTAAAGAAPPSCR